MKKLTSVLLAAMMVMSLNLSAFAVTDETSGSRQYVEIASEMVLSLMDEAEVASFSTDEKSLGSRIPAYTLQDVGGVAELYGDTQYYPVFAGDKIESILR